MEQAAAAQEFFDRRLKQILTPKQRAAVRLRNAHALAVLEASLQGMLVAQGARLSGKDEIPLEMIPSFPRSLRELMSSQREVSTSEQVVGIGISVFQCQLGEVETIQTPDFGLQWRQPCRLTDSQSVPLSEITLLIRPSSAAHTHVVSTSNSCVF